MTLLSRNERSMTMVEQLTCVSLTEKAGGNERPWPLIGEYLDYLRRAGMTESSLANFPGPAKHFLAWMGLEGISVDLVNVEVVRQFLAHDCHCRRPPGERYQHHHMRTHSLKGRVLHFVRFLEDTGRIRNPASLNDGLRRVAEFAAHLGEQGFAPGTVNSYGHTTRHFVVWLHQQHLSLGAIDEGVIRQFATHECICPGTFVHNAEPNRDSQNKVQRFVRFLVTIGVLPSAEPTENPQSEHLRAFRDWMRRHRGCGELRIRTLVQTIRQLLAQLGEDPGRYDAALINRVILQNLEGTSRFSAQRMCGSLRMYLRFLAATGACPPALLGAIPRIPRWRLATLPRYILNDDVERVIASCDPTTPRGLRDRAILLLLARLALRGGDVVNLHLHDIDWDNALIRVSGKTRRTVALPLPQDVGDALIAYIEHARPLVKSSKLFIRVIAPLVPFASSSPIGIIVRDALKRAGVKSTNLRGAYLLRHSAATHMLRSGATLEAVGAVLRHRSRETIAIYAKVDTSMLAQVAQPWIGGATCR
jgi:site-specific recombinase XerD